MLTDWINNSNLKLLTHTDNWQKAVEIALQPMIDNGAVEPRYLNAIYDMHKQIGPYYVLGEGIAMPHARPEEGVIRTALSLLIVSEGVSFGSEDNDPVYVIFALAAVDSHSHIEMIASLSQLFCEDGVVERLRQAREPSAVLEILRQF
ncbi:PTS sugar transporter subunit IIA [Erwinia aphidicola]|jgi:PTS system ascorbate-specific IIA component|uniref:PTS sugar transporter subunit IIA n=1 Tax=Erwinia aphidicola TaxID=68334 RepID=A0ABU8DE52_ERWAP|nr:MULTISPECIES: PTS sugar transporter subunit IIA [Erwinia]PIJ51758.1 PTS mannitol transporter subunit IIA [Erwinia sp. OLMDLW33]MBD1376284.1 PTS sugar transporter subunit IIA [Erwinia aphidicola]MCP2230521.1 PTS system ascorbate-specific IIA component [Erwinia aphidicola]MDI3440178.1 PTS sugar transporter subunit IIA [Erwinia sp. V90_4]CAH0226078.1 Ascorbate-specific PTS system EIIA component [Erwinia aphidicola]